MEIEKNNHINTLFEFYSVLLTEKQMIYMKLYYADDYSLGEIAEEFHVSRQAIADNLKRTEKNLEEYEEKLHLLENYRKRENLIQNLKNNYSKDIYLMEKLSEIQKID
jgi:predicted DNA-binding protein YlxM (UPF0122 family)